MLIDKNIQLRIVIVDDSRDDHFFIKESLKEFRNISFISFYNGEDFLNYMNEKDKATDSNSKFPDIVILDINMPKLTGFEVFKKINECGLKKNIPFFILTTNLTEADIEKCRELKLQCHKKPFSIDKFSILLQEIILASGKC
jgi:CheY-like chemotaxis protein